MAAAFPEDAGVAEVSHWLETNGLRSLVSEFESNRIDRESLLLLEENDIIALCPFVGDRAKFRVLLKAERTREAMKTREGITRTKYDSHSEGFSNTDVMTRIGRPWVIVFLNFLHKELHSSSLSTEKKGNIQVAIECLKMVYEINADPNDTTFLATAMTDMLQMSSAESVKTQSSSSEARVKTSSSAEDKARALKFKDEGNELMKKELYQEAVLSYTNAISLDESPVYYCNRASAHSHLNDHIAAIRDCEAALRLDSNYSKAYSRKGLAHASIGQHLQAHRCFREALRLEPSNEAYKANLQQAESTLKDTSTGASSSQDAERKPSKSVTVVAPAEDKDKIRAQKYKDEGNEHMKNENFEAAVTCYTNAINLDQTAAYYCNRAAAHSRLNNHQKALRDCEAALRLDYNYSKAYSRKGLAHAALEQHQEAHKCFREAVRLEPNNESYKSNLQQSEEKLRDTAKTMGAGALRAKKENDTRMTSSDGDEVLSDEALASTMAALQEALGEQGLDNLINDPRLMQMLPQMMANPEMQQMMAGMMPPGTDQSAQMTALLQASMQVAKTLQRNAGTSSTGGNPNERP